jgi:hypothetical protein
VPDRDETAGPQGQLVAPKPGPGFFTGNCRDFWAALPISLKRAIGLWFDCFCLVLLWLLPAAFEDFFSSLGASKHSFGHETKAVSSAALYWLLCTPLPIISLRFICKYVMHTPTPGEMLCGYTSKSTGNAVFALVQNFGLSLSQYLIVLLAGLLAVFPAFVIACIDISVVFGNSLLPAAFGSAGLVTGVGTAYMFSFLCLLRFCYAPFGNTKQEGWIDWSLGLRVVPLREDHSLLIGGESSK